MHTTFTLQLSNQFIIGPRYTQVSSIEWIKNDHMIRRSCVTKSYIQRHGRVSRTRRGEIQDNSLAVSKRYLSQTQNSWEAVGVERSADRKETCPTLLESYFPPILESCNGSKAISNSIIQSQISACAPPVHRRSTSFPDTLCPMKGLGVFNEQLLMGSVKGEGGN